MYTTPATKKFLANPESDQMVVEYLMIGLSFGPSQGIQVLLEEIEQTLCDNDRSAITKALDLLLANNNEIFPYTTQGVTS